VEALEALAAERLHNSGRHHHRRASRGCAAWPGRLSRRHGSPTRPKR
jgi:hypothetical protein